MRASRRYLLAMIAATVLTWVLGDPRLLWHPIATIAPGSLEQAGRTVRVDGSGGTVTKMLHVPMPVAPGSFGVEIATEASIEAVDEHAMLGQPFPATAQLSFSAGDQQLGVATVTALPRGETWAANRARATIPRGTERIELALVVGTGVGPHDFDVAPVRFAKRSDLYLAGAALLAGVWLLLASLLLRAAARAGAGRTLVAGCGGALLVIVAGTGLSESLPFEGVSEAVRQGVRSLTGTAPAALESLFGLGHFVAFAVAAVFAEALRRRLRLGRRTTVVALVTLALASEALQRHLPDRNVSLTDLVADVGGIAAALLLVGLWHVLRHGLRDSLSLRRGRERREAERRLADGRRSESRDGSAKSGRRRRRRTPRSVHALVQASVGGAKQAETASDAAAPAPGFGVTANAGGPDG